MLKQYLALSRTVHVLCVGALVNRAGAFLAPFLTLYLADALDLGVGFATTAMGVFGGGALVASLVGGHLADRIGRKTVMLISLFGGAAILSVFGLLTTPWSILAAVLAFSLFAEMYRPAASAMIADVTESAQRPQAFALMYVAINLGFAVAAAVGGILAELSFQWLFWGDALTAAAFGLLILFRIAETLPGLAGQPAPAETAQSTANLATDRAPNPRDTTLVAAARHIVADRVFLVFCAATFVLALVFMQSFTTFPIYLAELGHGARTYGLIISLNGIMIVFLQLPITSLVARYHRGWMISLAAIITGAGFALFGLAAAPWHFAMALTVWTAGEMIGSPVSMSIASDLAPQRFRARYMGVFTMSFSSSMMVGAPLGGLVLRELGGGYLWAICGLLGLTAALAYGALRHRLIAPTEKSFQT